MIDQIIPSLVSLIIGSALTMFVTYFSQTMTRKGDKDKVVREKLEEAYTLLNELKYWLKIRYYKTILIEREVLAKAVEDRGYADGDFEKKYDEYKKYRDKLNSFFSFGDFYTFDLDNMQNDCPIERIVMLISLYASTLKEPINNYESLIRDLKAFLINFHPTYMEMKKQISNIDIKELATKVQSLSEEYKQLDASSIKACYITLLKCEKVHKVLQSSLEKIIAKD